MSSSDILEISVKSAVGGAQYVYMHIPADALRHTVDGLFPSLAKNAAADAVSGFDHRWVHGHDLITDIVPQFFRHPVHASQQAGHILLTDFPTKAGIPIPGFSQSGLGALLVDLGIPKGYLSLNMMDTGIGLLAIGEGSCDLISAMSGNVPMDAWTAFDTFGEGGIELVLGYSTQNPLLIGAGIENILAGCVSTLRTFTDYVDPASFFGHSMTGAILGAGFSYALNRKKAKGTLGRTVLGTSARSALLGALSSASGYFTAGAFLGFTAMQIGKIMAAHAQKEQMLCCSCSPLTFEQQLKTFSEDDFFKDHWHAPPFLSEESLSVFDTPAYMRMELWVQQFLEEERRNRRFSLREAERPLL